MLLALLCLCEKPLTKGDIRRDLLSPPSEGDITYPKQEEGETRLQAVPTIKQ